MFLNLPCCFLLLWSCWFAIYLATAVFYVHRASVKLTTDRLLYFSTVISTWNVCLSDRQRTDCATNLQVINNPPPLSQQVSCSFPASTSSVHQRGRLFKECCLFCGSLNWQSWFVTAVLFIEQQPVLEFFLRPLEDPLQLDSNRVICPAVVRFGGNLLWYYLCSASLLTQQVRPCLNDWGYCSHLKVCEQ